MITYRLLTASDSSALYECFLEAFSDYQVDMQMSQQQFEQRLTRDGVNLEISAAAFDESRMIAFYLNATGMWQGSATAYDAGTGVIPAYRRQGIGKELFAFMVPRLKAAGMSQYLLEVLTGNESAVALYRQLGFVETRRFAVFRRKEPVAKLDLEGLTIRRIEERKWGLFKSFWDGYPSWQNSIDAVERVAGDTATLGAYVNEECVGYGVVFRPASSLMQLAVAPAHRRQGIGSKIVSALQSEVSEALKVNNVDEEMKTTLAFFDANGFRTVLEQYEMRQDLAD
ncbi:MAG TPA: GNAT family N-acetyltransferase [Pyrinomonadaceae bacterium]|nr:GNAT family N-acetyltransferase [Pyrinomonadaceae bacterium]